MSEENKQPGEGRPRAKGTTDMTAGRPGRHILLFSLPLLAGNVFQQMYNVVDTVIVGQGVGTSALAGVGTTAPIIYLITSLFVGIGLGATVLLSQLYGAGDLERVRRLVSSVYSVILPLVVTLTAACILLSGPLLRLINVPAGDTFDMAKVYMTIIALGFLGSFGFNLNAGILQSLGNSITPFVFLLIATVINIVLDVLFVIILPWGVAGAAVATAIAQMFSWLAGVVYINRHYSFLHLTLFKFDFDRSLFKSAMRIGLPSGINSALFALGVLVMQGLVNGQGAAWMARFPGAGEEDFMAGFNGAVKIDNFAFLPIQSISTAVTTFVGQNIGIGDIPRVRRGLRVGLLMSCACGILVGAIILPLGRFFLGLFVKGSPEPVLSAGLAYLNAVLPFFSLLAVLYVFNAVLQGAGHVMVPMVSTLVSLWLVRVPMAYFLTARFGGEYMYYAYAISWAAGIAISLGYYLTGRWKHNHFSSAQAPAVLE